SNGQWVDADLADDRLDAPRTCGGDRLRGHVDTEDACARPLPDPGGDRAVAASDVEHRRGFGTSQETQRLRDAIRRTGVGPTHLRSPSVEVGDAVHGLPVWC